MNQGKAEKLLFLAYTAIVFCGGIASITIGIAWGHWKGTLDQCIGRNCSCILYGVHTPTHFLGGDASSCIWATFGPLIYILLCIGMSCFHGFRVLFASKASKTRTVTSRNQAGEIVEIHAVQNEDANSLPRVFWIIVSVFSAFFTLYALIHFSIFVDGFVSTCNQYRKTLEKLIGGHGLVLPVLNNRLSCNAIFDFMDYIQPDSGNAYRDGFINTGIDLSIGAAAAFFTWILFFFTSVINIKFARNK